MAVATDITQLTTAKHAVVSLGTFNGDTLGTFGHSCSTVLSSDIHFGITCNIGILTAAIDIARDVGTADRVINIDHGFTREELAV